jgi:hypothetical protein
MRSETYDTDITQIKNSYIQNTVNNLNPQRATRVRVKIKKKGKATQEVEFSKVLPDVTNRYHKLSSREAVESFEIKKINNKLEQAMLNDKLNGQPYQQESNFSLLSKNPRMVTRSSNLRQESEFNTVLPLNEHAKRRQMQQRMAAAQAAQRIMESRQLRMQMDEDRRRLELKNKHELDLVNANNPSFFGKVLNGIVPVLLNATNIVATGVAQNQTFQKKVIEKFVGEYGIMESGFHYMSQVPELAHKGLDVMSHAGATTYNLQQMGSKGLMDSAAYGLKSAGGVISSLKFWS